MNKENVRGGLIPQELEISEHIVEAWNMFTKLEQTHPSDIEDFQKAIHSLQYILGQRVLRRLYPDFWLTHKKEKSILDLAKEIKNNGGVGNKGCELSNSEEDSLNKSKKKCDELIDKLKGED